MTIDTTLETTITAADVQTIAGEVWSSLMLDAADPVPSPGGEDTLVTASVSVTGTWAGHVTVDCGVDTGRSLTAMMLGIDVADIETADLADAVGELANMIGGRLKGLLPPPSTLSLPHVITGPGANCHFPHARPVCGALVPAVHGPVTVTVWLSSGSPREENS